MCTQMAHVPRTMDAVKIEENNKCGAKLMQRSAIALSQKYLTFSILVHAVRLFDDASFWFRSCVY